MSSHKEYEVSEGDGDEDIGVLLDPRDIKESALRRMFTELVRREAMRKKQASKRDPEVQESMEEEAEEENSKLADLHESAKGKSSPIPVTEEDVSEEAAGELKEKAKKAKA